MNLQENFPIYLNVYDIGPTTNAYINSLGIGYYHSCVQVHGKEYMFRAGDGVDSGIVSGDPQQLRWCRGLQLCCSILIGYTDCNANEVLEIIELMKQVYRGDSYNIFTKNCNHYSNQLCFDLTGNLKCDQIPLWVNRTAQFGLKCCCMLSVDELTSKMERIRVKALGGRIDEDNDADQVESPDQDEYVYPNPNELLQRMRDMQASSSSSSYPASLSNEPKTASEQSKLLDSGDDQPSSSSTLPDLNKQLLPDLNKPPNDGKRWKKSTRKRSRK